MQEKLSYQQLRADATTLELQAQNMKSILDKVKNQMERINTEGVWKSNAAQKAYDTFNELASKFPGFYDKVTSYATFLRNTAQAYEDADKAIQSKIG